MTTKLTASLIGVKMPEGAINPILIQSHNYVYSPRIEHSQGGVDLPTHSKWRILGIASEVKEEEWKNLLPITIDSDLKPVEAWKCYEPFSGVGLYFTATESGHSLLRSKGLDMNVLLIEKV